LLRSREVRHVLAAARDCLSDHSEDYALRRAAGGGRGAMGDGRLALRGCCRGCCAGVDEHSCYRIDPKIEISTSILKVPMSSAILPPSGPPSSTKLMRAESRDNFARGHDGEEAGGSANG